MKSPHRSLALCAATLVAPVVLSCSTVGRDDSMLLATLWVQHATEYEAVSLGAYALARSQLDMLLAQRDHSAALEQDPAAAELQADRPAIILDVDETVLDNSPYMGWQVRTGEAFSYSTWDEWCRKAEAGLVPGVKEFLDHAHARGVSIFYVTNRNKFVGEKLAEDLEGHTRENLMRHGLPMMSQAEGREADDVLLMRGELEMAMGRTEGWSSKKGARRSRIAANYRVLMLVGDNLGDFVDDYKGAYRPGDERPLAERVADVAAKRAAIFAANRERWGRDWIMLPNPTYGSWLGALNAFDRGDAGAALASARRSALSSFK